ncbi:MAG: nucleoside triphosphate pyrophosphohydrolase [Clostridia bacterium]|nr:nucleoside triphosphate pyrophosphohydrolase [Clostridia bacterium]
MITVVGMGNKSEDLTQLGAQTIKNAQVVVVKSALTHMKKTVESIRNDALYCDFIYGTAEDFDDLNGKIVEYLHSFGNKRVAFCVVGDGTDDSAVQLMDDVKIVHGVSLHSGVVGNNLASGTVVYTADDILSATRIFPQPTVIKCIDDKFVASEVQLKLQTVFDNDTKVVFGQGKNAKVITLDELCKQRYNYQSCAYVLPKDLQMRNAFFFYDCVDIMDVLRSPDGCPWDREQTHKSIIKNVIEEAYELADALEKEDIPHIIEELGDLLMQVIFHLAIAQEDMEFDPNDVYTALCRKLIDRHPHVFGDVVANNSTQSLDVWEQQKKKEHKIHTLAENVLDVPRGMSALMRTQKVQSRASKGGYEFENITQIVEKIHEELNEFLNATEVDKPMEGGDLLFAVVNLLRLSGVDSETAIMLSTEKFVRRVVECERILNGQSLKDLTMQQFDQVWSEAKNNVG